MYKLYFTPRFKKDIKRCERQKKDLQLFDELSDLLIARKRLARHYNDHKLTGNHKGCRECHIQPDWLLIYKVDKKEKLIICLGTGSHSELRLA